MKRALWLTMLAFLLMLAIPVALIQYLFTKEKSMVICSWCGYPIATSNIGKFKHKQRNYCCESHANLAKERRGTEWSPLSLVSIVVLLVVFVAVSRWLL